jgi:hypothetical protein
VEAAGVEPASERARHETTTCVSDSWLSATALRTGEENGRLARLISTYGYRRKPSVQTAMMTPTSGTCSPARRSGYLIN